MLPLNLGDVQTMRVPDSAEEFKRYELVKVALGALIAKTPTVTTESEQEADYISRSIAGGAVGYADAVLKEMERKDNELASKIKQDVDEALKRPISPAEKDELEGERLRQAVTNIKQHQVLSKFYVDVLCEVLAGTGLTPAEGYEKAGGLPAVLQDLKVLRKHYDELLAFKRKTIENQLKTYDALGQLK